MKRPVTKVPGRAARQSAGIAKTHKEAAVHLVRLEFDNARLRAGLAQATARASEYEQDLKRNAAERKALLSLLNR